MVQVDGRGLSLSPAQEDNRQAPLSPPGHESIPATAHKPGNVSPTLDQAKGFLNLPL
ncbi:hypothetical protein G4V39_02340 [Thermosulfuriphilus ammonigenes]|uniref:Uncharacterized protein n=1 Tax=Thermosulfuriphilus ammonigenes TaxID=1936021 RepID=A0A6G7PU21_9BACT|nr:hypothetical protein [Thermosulfuriphilus ammonigenes]QIJ71184.1 hypothetical protein G4V39_02340 [Thermosulfuriphilus ammonigenes]